MEFGLLHLQRQPDIGDEPSKRYLSVRAPRSERFVEHPGMALNPRKIVAIFALAEQGWPQVQCDLFEDVVERDGHLRAQIEPRIEAVAGKSWTLQAGGPDPADIDAAHLLEDAVRAVPNVPEVLEHQLTSTFYGYAATEIVWEQNRDGMVVPVWFGNTPHRRFRFDEDDNPFVLVDDDTRTGIALERGRWMFSRRRGRRAARAGLLRSATWWSHFKTLSVRDWVLYSEKFGLPYILGRYEEGASDEDKKVLKQALQELGKDSIAALSKNVEVLIESAKAGGKSDDVHGALVALCNAEISKLITGATLTGETGGPGSFALGRVHQDTRFDLVQSDAERLAIRFEQDVGVPFVRFNSFPAGTRPPRLKIHVVRDVAPKERAEIMAVVLNELRLPLDAEQIRQEFQLKAPRAGGEAATPEQAPGRTSPVV